jgi:DNA polymerase III delta subunit
MITLLTGDNSFELNQALEVLKQNFAGEIERIDGSELASDRLIELFSGASLFSSNRMVVIRDLSVNKSLWLLLGDQLDRISDDVHLVLVEPSVDKRTATYKRLQKIAEVRSFAAWTERDVPKAETWVEKQAIQLGLKLDKKSIQTLVRRVGVDQWQLYHALEKLVVLDKVDSEVIESTIEAQATENVFNLFDAALRGNTGQVSQMIHSLERTQDPYMTFGLLSGQVFQLAALATTDKPASVVASDIGAHPYALSKLAPHAKTLGRAGSRKVVTIFADTDIAMKSLGADPWLLIEQALIKTTRV